MTPDIDVQMADQFTGNFLDASDIMANGNITLTISDVVGPNVDKDATGKTINKAIVAFKGAKKRLILNKTNAKVISMAHGKKPSLWIGKQVTLTVRWLRTAFGQDNVPVVRVVPPDGTSLTFGMRSKYGAATSFAKQEREPGE